ncbi:MAG TPA: hypothetical protein ENI56_00300 [Candidatus Kaiserbacteria bacterium]|nr:hypothetical protein [Candidatus Kaiserbacteria bacterium]
MSNKTPKILFLTILTLFLIGIFLNPLTALLGSIISSGVAQKTVIAYPTFVEREIAKEQSTVIPYAYLPSCAVNGIISVEDKRFYYTNGIDIVAVARVLLKSFVNDHQDHGGSTITQQLARRIISEPRHVANPVLHAHGIIRVLYYTFIVNTVFSKHEILSLYLNSVYYGRGATGIAQAARTYFHTDLPHLTFGQCVYLTGLPQAPSVFGNNPGGKRAMDRYRHVVGTMLRNGYISAKTADALSQEKLFIQK